jgi:hypothetical protein
MEAPMRLHSIQSINTKTPKNTKIYHHLFWYFLAVLAVLAVY